MPYADPAKRAELQRRRRLGAPLPVKWNSPPHIALGFLKMERHRFVAPQELVDLTPRLVAAVAVLDKLRRYGYAEVDSSGAARVTDNGVALLYEMAKRRAMKGMVCDEDDDS